MAITYVGGQTAGRTNPSSALSVNYSLTGGSDATPAAGDLVIVCAVTGSAAGNPAMAVTTPATWVALGQLNQSAVTADTSLDVSYKFMSGTPDTAVTIPGTGNNAFGEAYSIQVFRGVDSTTPLDGVTPASAGGTGTGRPDPAQVTPATAGAWVVICGGGAAGTGANYTGPTDFTTDFLTSSGADTTDAMVGSGYWDGWTSGAVNPGAYTGGTTGANDSWAAYTLVLRPAATIGDLAGSAAISLSPTAAMAGDGALAGSAAVTLTPTAAITGDAPITGSASISFTPTATLDGISAVDGSASIAFAPVGTLAGAGALAGAAALAVDGAATLVGDGALAGSSALSLDGTAAMTGDAPITGAASLAFAPVGAMTGAAALAGSASVEIGASGALDQPAGVMAGTAALSIDGTASMTGAGALAGSASLAFTPSGAMVVFGDLSGVASLSFTQAGVLLADGALAGSSVLTLLATGVFDYVADEGDPPRQTEVGGGPGVARLAAVYGAIGSGRGSGVAAGAGIERTSEIANQAPTSAPQRNA